MLSGVGRIEAVDAGPGALREVLVVLLVGAGGLLLAVLAAFTPWYPAAGRPARAVVVELRSPQPVPATDQIKAG